MLAYKAAKDCKGELYTNVVITLEIPEDALTNLERTSIVDKSKATYRTNKAKVLKIEDFNGNMYTTAFSVYDESFDYNVGETKIVPNYHKDTEKVHVAGIHFFLEKEVAEFYAKDESHNGLRKEWYEDGQQRSEMEYLDGKIVGTSKHWYPNGKLHEAITYENENTTKVETWYMNGTKLSEYHVINHKQDGLVSYWHDNGNQHVEEFYEYGTLIYRKIWDKDGNALPS